MTDHNLDTPDDKTKATKWVEEKNRRISANVKKRLNKERRFRFFGIASLSVAFVFLATLLVSIVSKGYGAFITTEMQIDVFFDPERLELTQDFTAEQLQKSDFGALVKDTMRQRFPDVSKRKDKKMLYGIVSSSAEFVLKDMLAAKPDLLGKTVSIWVLADDEVDGYLKGIYKREQSEKTRRFKDKQMDWVDDLQAQGQITRTFNTTFFTSSDSREPEQAGILGAMMGSFYLVLVTLILSFPIGIATAIYLEEFAPKNKISDFIEVNINNLAAVPSIVFGLLGAAVFLNVMHLPRSAALVGGLVLTLMTLPTIIISSRAAIKSVPPSMREAALGLGASKMQMVLHHVIPQALPGMLTGTIIGMAQALGETAPLLMIGMVAFVTDVPGSPLDPSTALPVQIFQWADSPERAFDEKTSGAIMVLLMFLAFMNASAVYLRKKFETK